MPCSAPRWKRGWRWASTTSSRCWPPSAPAPADRRAGYPGAHMQKIVPFLWFDGKAEEAMQFYVSIFPDSKVGSVNRAGPNGPVFSVSFQLAGQEFQALNGGPMYSFTPAISLFVNCETQAEVDELWARLTAGGGEEQPCGWLKDKFGVSW